MSDNRVQGAGGRDARPTGPTGFTLIEILISVLILALGVLGLGALFPVVIKQQRNGADATYGVLAAQAAKATLTTLDYHSALPAFTGTPDNRDVWLDWRNDAARGLNNRNLFERGEWLIPEVDSNNTLPNAVEIGLKGSTSAFWLSVRDRLYPTASPAGPAPQFVWDLAVHRVSDFDPVTNATADGLEVAVFVRRIDPRIRVLPGLSLFRELTDPSVAQADRRRPVGVDPAQGIPTLDGTGKYALPLTAPVTFFDNPSAVHRDRLHLVPAPPAAVLPLIKQGGQRLVDNLGNIYTVMGSGSDTNGPYVQVAPPVPSPMVSTTAATISQVVFTPQVPAAVLVFKVNP